jgi:hypothetical protein
MKILAIATVLTTAFLLAAPAFAGGMQVEPGTWEYTTTSKNSMMPGPRTMTMTRCITTPEVDPEAFMEEAQDCELTDIESDASSMHWKMVCTHPGGVMRGETHYTSTGATIRGTMTMTMTAEGQTMTMETQTEGRRLGACD